jgi:hypothetical protein
MRILNDCTRIEYRLQATAFTVGATVLVASIGVIASGALAESMRRITDRRADVSMFVT